MALWVSGACVGKDIGHACGGVNSRGGAGMLGRLVQRAWDCGC